MTERIDDLITEIADIGEKEAKKAEAGEKKKQIKRVEPTEEIKEKKKLLKAAAASGEIDRTVKSVEKLTAKGVDSAYAEWENLKQLKRQTFLCHLMLDKLSGALGYFGLVENPDSLRADLQGDQLLAYDITQAITYVEPYVPFVGLLSGTLTVAAHALTKSNEEKPTE